MHKSIWILRKLNKREKRKKYIFFYFFLFLFLFFPHFSHAFSLSPIYTLTTNSSSFQPFVIHTQAFLSHESIYQTPNNRIVLEGKATPYASIGVQLEQSEYVFQTQTDYQGHFRVIFPFLFPKGMHTLFLTQKSIPQQDVLEQTSFSFLVSEPLLSHDISLYHRYEQYAFVSSLPFSRSQKGSDTTFSLQIMNAKKDILAQNTPIIAQLTFLNIPSEQDMTLSLYNSIHEHVEKHVYRISPLQQSFQYLSFPTQHLNPDTYTIVIESPFSLSSDTFTITDMPETIFSYFSPSNLLYIALLLCTITLFIFIKYIIAH